MDEAILRQRVVDEEHLKLLALGYKISGGINALFSLYGLVYVFMGLGLGLAARSSPVDSGGPPDYFGYVFAGIGLLFMLGAIILTAAKFRTALCIEQRRSLGFCQVVAALTCLEVPYGTALGVLTFQALGRASVHALFATGGDATPMLCPSCGEPYDPSDYADGTEPPLCVKCREPLNVVRAEQALQPDAPDVGA